MPEPLLQVEGLTKFFGGLRAVSGVSLEVPEDDLVALIGPNGAGKTTVFNLITGLLRSTSGRVTLAGKDITGLRPHQIAGLGISRTFQNIRLFREASVLDNVRVALHPETRYGLLAAALQTRLYALGERSCLDRATEILATLGLDNRRDVKAGSLPYGDQRRLEIARALAVSPRVLLLDEPAAGMNPSEVRDLVNLVRRIKSQFKVSVLIIEHQMGVIMNLCREIVVMDFGEVIARGTPAGIQADERVLEAYLGRGAAAETEVTA